LALACALLPSAANRRALAWQAPATPAAAPAEITLSTRIIDQDPYDEIVSKKTGEVVKIALLDFRKMPDPVTTRGKKLTVKKLDDAQDFEVAWNDIKEIHFFEQTVLDEARAMVEAGKGDAAKFDEVYEYFDYLKRMFPGAAGLDAALGEYLVRDASHWNDQKKYQQALALLNEAYEVYPQTPRLQATLGAMTQRIVEQHADKGNFIMARRVLRDLAKKYRSHPVVAKMEAKWADDARTLLEEARGHFEAGEPRKAWESGIKMLNVWPKLPEGRALMEQLYAEYPMVNVGVTSAAGPQPSDRMIDWAARRNSRLQHRLLVEFSGVGPEGGEYSSPFGEAKSADIGRRVIFNLRDNIRWSGGEGALTGADVARRLLWYADRRHAGYDHDWSNLLGGVEVRDGYKVDVDLRWSHVRPMAMMQFSITGALQGVNGGAAPASLGPYTIAQQTTEETHYQANPDYFGARAGQLKEINEIYFADSRKARAALETGRIQVLDRIDPWEVERFKENSALVVEPYLLPSIHCLLPNPGRPFTAHRSFRRALVYGIDRKLIVEHDLLRTKGTPREGCTVISGPFPIGIRNDDPIRYAYNLNVEVRPFEQPMAMALAGLALKQVSDASEKKGEGKIEKIPTLVLAHPAQPIARVACKAIQRHLEIVLSRVGASIVASQDDTANKPAATTATTPAAPAPPPAPKAPTITLRELPPGVVVPSDGEYDLLYLEVLMQDPIVDAVRLLGVDGTAGGNSPFLNLALRQLVSATGWKAAHDKLHEIHQLAADEVPVVPLWQLREYFAYHKSLKGIGSQPALLYQNIEQWQGQLQLALEDE
jgi:ABC-type transport system substrate-binding protein